MEKDEKQEISAEVLQMIEASVKNAVSEALKQQQDQKKAKMLYNTRILMESYGEMKKYIKNAISEEEEMQKSPYMIFAGENAHLISVRNAKMQTSMMIANIDRALDELESDFSKKSMSYKFEAFKMRYIDEMTVEQIAEKLNCGKNSPSAWCKVVMKHMAIKLFGINGLFQVL